MAVKTLTLVLILVSVLASAYYFFAGLTKPESVVVYSRASIPARGIRTWAVLLGASGILLLFSATFRLATILMVTNSLFTVTCLVINEDLRGAAIESLLLLIPIFLFRVGYPMFALEKVRALLWH